MIRKSTPKDLLEIESWLEEEDKDEEGSFWSNIELIRKAHNERKLYVLLDPEAVAFIMGTATSLDILAVKKDKRNKGYGKTLAEFYIKKLWKTGLIGLRIQCKPLESQTFWERMGFEMDPTSDRDVYMYITHPRQRKVSKEANIRTVEIEVFNYFQENILVEPVCILAEEKNGKLMLSKEYVQFIPDWHSTMVLSIAVDGKQIHLDFALDSKVAGVNAKFPFMSIWEFDLSKAKLNPEFMR